MNEAIEEQNISLNWLEEEERQLTSPTADFERLPVINTQFAENKIVRMKIDATKPFRKWEDKKNDKIKVIIPVMGAGKSGFEKMVFFLNISNPLYKDIIHLCRASENKAEVSLAVIQTGSKKDTKYSIVKE